MKLTRYASGLLSSMLGFLPGKAPTQHLKIPIDRYPLGFNRARENARRARQLEDRQLRFHRVGPGLERFLQPNAKKETR